MVVFRRVCRVIAFPMALILAMASYPASGARAALIGTEQAVSQNAARMGDTEAQRARISSFLQRADVRGQIQALGVDPHEADARVAGLSDVEVAKLAGQVDQLPAGQGVVAVFIILGIIFAVLVALDLLGVTHVFKVFR